MATKYAVGELHPNTNPQRISDLLNRAGGDGWELVTVVNNSSRGFVQYFFRRGGGGAAFAEASRNAS
jgi:hypothetical protein